MPLLAKETDVFPEHLFSLPATEYPWTVVRVRSRHEKTLARHLGELGVAFYLPLIQKRVKRSGRTFASYHPIFSGYVFVRARADQRQMVMRSGAVVQVVGVIDQEQFSAELGQIRQLQLAGAWLEPFPGLLPGDAVRIRDGVFRGYRGVVTREKSRHRLIVTI